MWSIFRFPVSAVLLERLCLKWFSAAKIGLISDNDSFALNSPLEQISPQTTPLAKFEISLHAFERSHLCILTMP
jgi:hypothetical protein